LHQSVHAPPARVDTHDMAVQNVAALLEECLSRTLGTTARNTPKANLEDCEAIVSNHEANIQFNSIQLS
jgi:hypothetical protein